MRMAAIPVTVRDKANEIRAIEARNKIRGKVKRVLRQSKWLILVNSNIKPSNAEQANAIADGIKGGLRRVIEDKLQNVIVFNRPGDSWNTDSIKSVELQMAAEVGHSAKGGRVHLHAILDVWHWSNISLPSRLLRDELRPLACNPKSDLFCGSKNLFVRVKWIPSDRALEEYIEKDVSESLGDLKIG